MFNIESAIERWRGSFCPDSVGLDQRNELEAHLRELTSELCKRGLSEREAFMVGTDRLGHPSELELEYAKNGSASLWSSRVFWMLTGFIAMTVGGSIISVTAAIVASGLAIVGIGGIATGGTMVTIQALGWIGVLALFYRLSQHAGVPGNFIRYRWVVVVASLLMFAPLLVGSGNMLRAKYIGAMELGQSAYVYSLGSWAIQLAVCFTCLILMTKLRDTAILNGQTIS